MERQDTAPETIGGNGQSVDRWTFTGKAGTRVAIVEQPASNATISFTTPGGQTGTLTDQGGGSITFANSEQTTITIDTSGVTVNSPAGQVQITAASEVIINAPSDHRECRHEHFQWRRAMPGIASDHRGGHHLHARSGKRMVMHDIVVSGVNLAGALQSRPVLLQIDDNDFPKAFLQELSAIPQPPASAMYALLPGELPPPATTPAPMPPWRCGASCICRPLPLFRLLSSNRCSV